MSQVRCKLAILRKKRNLKQTELAQMTGLSQKALSELETRKSKGIAFVTLAKLCDVLNIGLEQLFELVDEEKATMSLSRMSKPSCSFCSKNENEVNVLIVANFSDKPSVYICSDCITRCNQLL